MLSLASEAVTWGSSTGRNTVSVDAINGSIQVPDSETIEPEIMKVDLDTTVSLMHLGFDSMRLVLFRDALLRAILPHGIVAPTIFSRLFGTEKKIYKLCSPY